MAVSRMTTSLFVLVALNWLSYSSAFRKDPPSSDTPSPCAYYCQFGFMPGICNCDVLFGLPVAKETPCMFFKCGANEKCAVTNNQAVCIMAESKTSVADPSVSEPILDFCHQPKLIGQCRDAIKRYYFNTKKGICEKFIFSGCDGNLNNFLTLSVCQAACERKQVDENFATIYTAPGI